MFFKPTRNGEIRAQPLPSADVIGIAAGQFSPSAMSSLARLIT
jgi:hypothetical protein